MNHSHVCFGNVRLGLRVAGGNGELLFSVCWGVS